MPTNVRRRLFGLLAGSGAATMLLVGCGKSEEKPAAGPERPVAQVETPGKKAETPSAKTVPAQPVSRQQPSLKGFKESVILEPPDTQLRPPDVTAAGKNVAHIFEAVAGKNFSGGLFDQVAFVDAAGKRIDYTATLKTDLGDVQIEFFPDAAPNHVRSFIALAKAGYFDGLPFHASQRLETPEKQWAYLETGCPKGTGEAGYGSVGYWLRPEASDTLTHEAGTVGAWHDEDPDTAAGRFYVTLHKAPAMDGMFTIFGKIKSGLDVAHTINRRPVFEEYPFDRPKEPVVIRQVVIHTTVTP